MSYVNIAVTTEVLVVVTVVVAVALAVISYSSRYNINMLYYVRSNEQIITADATINVRITSSFQK